LATQIWPLADDQESTYFTKLKRKKKKKNYSSNHLNIATQNVVVELLKGQKRQKNKKLDIVK
jgi:hypothetical protein